MALEDHQCLCIVRLLPASPTRVPYLASSFPPPSGMVRGLGDLLSEGAPRGRPRRQPTVTGTARGRVSPVWCETGVWAPQRYSPMPERPTENTIRYEPGVPVVDQHTHHDRPNTQFSLQSSCLPASLEAPRGRGAWGIGPAEVANAVSSTALSGRGKQVSHDTNRTDTIAPQRHPAPS